MRIIFVLKCQASLKPFICGVCSRKLLSLQFDSYDYASEFKFIQFYLKVGGFC